MRIVCLLILSGLVACKQAPQPASTEGVWQESDSQFFSVKFPAKFSASSFNMGDETKIFPALNLKSDSGGLIVAHDSTYAGMLLRDGVAAGIQLLEERGGRLLVPSHNIASKNGTCIGFVVSDPARACPKEIKAKDCFPIGYVAHCETPFGKRFLAMGILAQQTNNARLEAGAVERAKLFDRIMATLEFKKF